MHQPFEIIKAICKFYLSQNQKDPNNTIQIMQMYHVKVLPLSEKSQETNVSDGTWISAVKKAKPT